MMTVVAMADAVWVLTALVAHFVARRKYHLPSPPRKYIYNRVHRVVSTFRHAGHMVTVVTAVPAVKVVVTAVAAPVSRS